MEAGLDQTVIDLVVSLFASAGEKPGFDLAAAMARLAVRAGFDQGEETQPDPDSHILLHHYIVVAHQNFVDYQNHRNRHNPAGSQMIADCQSFPEHQSLAAAAEQILVLARYNPEHLQTIADY